MSLWSGQSVSLTADSPLEITLDGQASVMVSINAQAGDVISVTARAIDEIDTTLELITPDGDRYAFNDDIFGDLGDDLRPTDSQIQRVALTETGDYAVRVNSFNGVSVGVVALTLDIHDTQSETVTLLPASPHVQTLTLQAGQILTVTAQHADGRFDPLLVLSDADGETIARNDDHDGTDLTLNVWDSHLVYTAQTAQTVTLTLSEFLGRASTFRLTVETE